MPITKAFYGERVKNGDGKGYSIKKKKKKQIGINSIALSDQTTN